jgi:hypothetical protein
MQNQFDELAKGLAQSVTRRAAFRKLGVGVVGVVLASLGLPSKAYARRLHGCRCKRADYGCNGDPNCVSFCAVCCAGGCF